MTQILKIHPTHPPSRLIDQVVKVLQAGGVMAYPTDTAYALGCRIGDKQAQERIQKIRALDKTHHFTLVCQNLSELSLYARVSNPVFRLLKAYTPGAYTFILPATSEVPKRLQNAKRKTIGLRVIHYPIASAILSALAEPIMSVSLILPGQNLPIFEFEQVYQALQGKVDLIIDAGDLLCEVTTVVDFLEEVPKIIRFGKGDAAAFL